MKRLALVLSGLGALAAAGCGDAANPAADFAGTWRYVDYSSLLTQPNVDAMSEPPLTNKTFGLDPNGGLVDLSPSPLLNDAFCDFRFDVNGPVATARPGQICYLTSLDTLTIDSAVAGGPPQWTFTLNSPTTAEELVTATAHYDITGTASTYQWSFTAHLQRVSKD